MDPTIDRVIEIIVWLNGEHWRTTLNIDTTTIGDFWAIAIESLGIASRYTHTLRAVEQFADVEGENIPAAADPHLTDLNATIANAITAIPMATYVVDNSGTLALTLDPLPPPQAIAGEGPENGDGDQGPELDLGTQIAIIIWGENGHSVRQTFNIDQATVFDLWEFAIEPNNIGTRYTHHVRTVHFAGEFIPIWDTYLHNMNATIATATAGIPSAAHTIAQFGELFLTLDPIPPTPPMPPTPPSDE